MLVLIVAMLLCPSLQAAVSLDIKIINQKGIDKDFTLTSELHSIEDIVVGKTSVLRMKSGLKLIYSARFLERPETYGPRATLLISGKIVNNKNQTLHILDPDNMPISIGSQKTVIYDKSDQRLEITFKPLIH